MIVSHFAMEGSTHSMWTLNLYTKGGVDAAKCGSEQITFSEYMKLFEKLFRIVGKQKSV